MGGVSWTYNPVVVSRVDGDGVPLTPGTSGELVGVVWLKVGLAAICQIWLATLCAVMVQQVNFKCHCGISLPRLGSFVPFES